MLRTNRNVLVGILGALGALALSVGCGGSSDSPAPGDATGGSGGGGEVTPPCTDCITPPGPPADCAGDGAGATLAVSKLFLGDTDWDGAPSSTAWKSFGYDLDGIASTKATSNHCQGANAGANKSAIQTDGNGGIDNSFGSNILPIITSLASDASMKINENIDSGAFTIILKIDTLGGGSNYVNLPAALYAGAQLADAEGTALTPKWDGTDQWPVYCELMTDCQTTGTKQFADGNESTVLFPSSYVADGTWVSGSKGNVNLSLSVQGYSLSLTIGQATLTADLDTGNPPASATKGIIAGVLDTTQLIDSLRSIAGNISTSMCDGPTFDSIASQIAAASDIMKNGTQDPNQKCDGISIGLGFDMKAVQLGSINDKAPPGPDPCAAP